MRKLMSRRPPDPCGHPRADAAWERVCSRPRRIQRRRDMNDVNNRDERMGPGTYLTQDEAKEFHKLFITSFLIFTVVAIIAHVRLMYIVWPKFRPIL